MTPRPMAQQRSDWHYLTDDVIDGLPVSVWRRNVNDGALVAFTGKDHADKWHLSISHRFHARKLRLPNDPTTSADPLGRYPAWDEIVHAARRLLPYNLTYAMFIPPDEDYLAWHPTTFHLHEVTTWMSDTPLPLPENGAAATAPAPSSHAPAGTAPTSPTAAPPASPSPATASPSPSDPPPSTDGRRPWRP